MGIPGNKICKRRRIGMENEKGSGRFRTAGRRPAILPVTLAFCLLLFSLGGGIYFTKYLCVAFGNSSYSLNLFISYFYVF